MKKKIETVALLMFIITTVIGLTLVYNLMSSFGYKKIGEQAVNIAKLTSASLEITDAQVEELLNIEFSELSENEVNKQLEELFVNANLSDNIEYVYVLSQLEPSEVKYTVDDQEKAEFFGEEIGTPLNYVWLLDYIVNDEVRDEALNDADYYDDIYRYTAVDDITRNIYKNKSTTFILNEDEWDKTITAYVPINTVEGTYIGLLGVDIFASDYYDYRDKIFVFGLCIFIFLGLLLFIVLSCRYMSDRNELHTDQLSGLYRRRYYEKFGIKTLKELGVKHQSLTIIMLDIDEFKRYNDFYGHMRGDVVISTVSKIIKESADAFGAKAGRFGGEEFIIIAPNISIQEGDLLCEKIRKDVEQLNICHENGCVNKLVTMSIGSFTLDKDDKKMTFEEVIEAADVGLYRAKHDGRNRYVRHNILK